MDKVKLIPASEALAQSQANGEYSIDAGDLIGIVKSIEAFIELRQTSISTWRKPENKLSDAVLTKLRDYGYSIFIQTFNKDGRISAEDVTDIFYRISWDKQ